MDDTPTQPATVGDVLNISEAAAYLRLSESYVYELARAGRIPATKVGSAARGKWLFLRDELLEWVRANRPAAGGPGADSGPRSAAASPTLSDAALDAVDRVQRARELRDAADAE